jgi:hypothetical protein
LWRASYLTISSDFLRLLSSTLWLAKDEAVWYLATESLLKEYLFLYLDDPTTRKSNCLISALETPNDFAAGREAGSSLFSKVRLFCGDSILEWGLFS